MYSRKIEDCVPKLRSAWLVFKSKVKVQLGLDIILTCTAREYIEQLALYSQGREELDMVNHKRENAGLPPIDAAHNIKVTWTLDSKHIIGSGRAQAEAFDIAIVKNDKAVWDVKADINGDNMPDYRQVAEIGKGFGLRAGADFKNPDYPHFEI